MTGSAGTRLRGNKCLIGVVAGLRSTALRARTRRSVPATMRVSGDGRCTAVDGLAQSWAPDAQGSPLCFVFPPLALLRGALVKVHERTEAMIVLPWQRALSPAIAALLAALPVVQRVQLRGNHASMAKSTSAVPHHVRGAGWATPLQDVRVSRR